MTAAMQGSREVAFTIVSMTLSLAAVFIPVLFMGGVVGRLLHEFAVTIGVAILVSGFVSITLTPMLSARFLKPPKARHGHVYMAFERTFDASRAVYGWLLRKAMTHHVDDDGRLGAAGGRDRMVVHEDSDRVHSEPGHRPDFGHDRGRPGHRLRDDGRAPAAGGGDRPGRSERAERDVEYRLRRAAI